ncbi:anti-sigma B factor antagonist [Lentzea xinjiangensis]|uniref:Anti-sigma factor antagonist n=1 Tax=Lentzea xinjiangensis TaxID=402600 RepID=A0A1H9TVG5_9PSEU|nr:STAS domain-containing protein [Lentzea xinjiangensis]SES01032.1 anti-sigma B factor antagonist [Lentzea xinjiangensis]
MIPEPAVTVSLTTATEDRVVIGVGGEIDHATAHRMHDDVLALTSGGTIHLQLDFSGVGFCDSSGMSALLGIWRHLHAHGGTLAISAVPAKIAKALRIGGLDQIITVHLA